MAPPTTTPTTAVFFYAEGKANGTSDAWEYYKDADVYVGKDNAPSIDDTVTVLVVTGDDNVAKAVVVVDAATASNGDYLFLVKETGTVKDGKTYTAIVGNDVMVGETEITVKGGATALGLWQYSVNADGLYELEAMTSNTVVTGVITRDPAGKSIVLAAAATDNDGEYTLNSDAVVAFIDGDDSYTGADLSKGDAIQIVTNSDREVEAVYVTVGQSDSAAKIVDTTLAAGDPQDYTTTETAVSTITGKILVTSGATVKVVSEKPATLDAAKSASSETTLTATTGGADSDGVYYIVVLSNDQTAYSVYSLKVTD